MEITKNMERIPLWNPGEGGEGAENVTIQYFIPDKAAGAVVVVCPGGAYCMLADTYEGEDIARWFNHYGITAVVLRYRLAPHRYPLSFTDLSLAMRRVRSDAKKDGLDPHKIGVIGFSAGGHLAGTVAVRSNTLRMSGAYADVSDRPDFQLLIYPVVTMGEKCNVSSRDNLFGSPQSPELLRLASNELQVTDNTPPAFVCHSVQDQAVSVDNSRMYVAELKRHNVPVEYLELATGAHGLGCGRGFEWEAWQRAALEWLRTRGLTGK